MLQALRQSAHRTGRLLLPLLLLSWLSLVCGHCVALAGEFDTMPVGHHGEVDAGHDCCPGMEGGPCLSGDCEHAADVQQAPLNGKSDQQNPPMLVAGIRIESSTTRRTAMPVHPPSFPPGPFPPLYLRNCVFLI